jgi:hypothetical protein
MNLKSKLSEAELYAEGQRAAMLWNLERYELEVQRRAGILPAVEPIDLDHKLSDALAVYLELHESNTNKRFVHDAHYLIDKVIAIVGDKDIGAYTRADARKVSDSFTTSMKTTSARVYINKIVAIVNKASKEWGLTIANNFSSLDIRNEGKDAKQVEDFTADELAKIQAACLERNDDIAWTVALQLATGARISEVVKLRVADIDLGAEIPLIRLCEDTGLGQVRKTAESQRSVSINWHRHLGRYRSPQAILGAWRLALQVWGAHGHRAEGCQPVAQGIDRRRETVALIPALDPNAPRPGGRAGGGHMPDRRPLGQIPVGGEQRLLPWIRACAAQGCAELGRRGMIRREV